MKISIILTVFAISLYPFIANAHPTDQMLVAVDGNYILKQFHPLTSSKSKERSKNIMCVTASIIDETGPIDRSSLKFKKESSPDLVCKLVDYTKHLSEQEI